MRLLLLANNWAGSEVVRWLRERGEEIAGLVLHPPARRRFGEETLAAAGLPEGRVFPAESLRDPGTLRALGALRADLALSVSFGYILRREFLDLFPGGVVNLHAGLLPWNRGAHGNVWSILERTPAGATLHWVDEGIDTGDLIAQRAVEADAADTGETLYRKTERASVDLFRETWPRLREGRAERRPQPPGGSFHRVKDLASTDEIDPDRSYRARDLIDLLRARTFPPHDGVFLRDGADRIYLRLSLERRREHA
jgi:methionyl-tRNA formyltransferase